MIDRSDPYGNEDKNRKRRHAAFREFAADIKFGAYPELGNLLGNSLRHPVRNPLGNLLETPCCSHYEINSAVPNETRWEIHYKAH